MSRLVVAAVGLLVLLWQGSLHAQWTIGHRLLERRSVVLTIAEGGVGTTCLGFRLTPGDFPSNVDLVLTAAHCLYDVSNPVVTAATLGRQSGRSLAAFMWGEYDLAMLLVTPRLGLLEPLRYAHTALPAELSVLAMVRGGGGIPTIAAARVLGQEEHIVYLGMPAAPGSSGGAVVDPSAFLVGMISSGTPIVRGGTTTPFVMAVGANAIFGMWEQERERILARARELNR